MAWRNYLERRRAAFGFAAKGVRQLLSSQPHAQLHLASALVVVIAAAYFRVSSGEWCILLLCIALVWCCEAINTAIECVVDLASPEFHPLAGRAKDIAAGAVLLAAGLAALIGAIIFVPRLASLFP